jgi:predicted HicB family RNase H-like nuclease
MAMTVNRKTTQALTLRLPVDLHARLKAIAEREGRSVNNLLTLVCRRAEQGYREQYGI